MTSTQFQMLYEQVDAQINTKIKKFRKGILTIEAANNNLAVFSGDKCLWDGFLDTQHMHLTMNKKLHALS